MNHRDVIELLIAAISGSILFTAHGSWGQPPTPIDPVPNAKQIEWYHRETMVFLHFNMNTFTGNEWGDGTDSPTRFNPTTLDCEQWIRTVKNAGFTCAGIF